MRKEIFGLPLVCLILALACHSCKDGALSPVMSDDIGNPQRIERPHSSFAMIEEMHGRTARLAFENAIIAFKELYYDKYQGFVNEDFGFSMEFYTQELLRNISLDYNVPGNDTLFYLVNFSNNNGFALVDDHLRVLAVNDNCNFHLSDFNCDMSEERFNNNPGKWMIAGLINVSAYCNSVIQPYPTTTFMFNEIDSVHFITNDYESTGPFVQMELSQRDPYNRYCFTPEGFTAVAGSAPVAIAGMFSANVFPDFNDDYSWHQIIYDWNQNHNSILYGSTFIPVRNALFKRIADIGENTSTQYGVFESNTTQNDIIQYLRQYYGHCEFKRPRISSYDYHEFLANRISLLVTGYMTIDENSFNHYWVFDGDVIHNYEANVYNHGNHITIEGSDTLIHCRLGWGGDVDGYYHFDIFRPLPNNQIIDERTLIDPRFPSTIEVQICWNELLSILHR